MQTEQYSLCCLWLLACCSLCGVCVRASDCSCGAGCGLCLLGLNLSGLMDGGMNQHAFVPVPRRAREFRDCYELDIVSPDGSAAVDERCEDRRPQKGGEAEAEEEEGVGMGHGEL